MTVKLEDGVEIFCIGCGSRDDYDLVDITVSPRGNINARIECSCGQLQCLFLPGEKEDTLRVCNSLLRRQIMRTNGNGHRSD